MYILQIKKSFEKIINNKKNKLGYAIGNGKKRPYINKDWFFHLKSRTQFESVFAELAGNKPLQDTRKVPIMFKKDEIFYVSFHCFINFSLFICDGYLIVSFRRKKNIDINKAQSLLKFYFECEMFKTG